MEPVQVHPWSQSIDVHLWLCRVQHAPEERHPLPQEMRKLTDADVFYLLNELNELAPYATFIHEKNKALILYRWLCHLLVEEGSLNELPCMADRPSAKRLHKYCVKAGEPWSKRAVQKREWAIAQIVSDDRRQQCALEHQAHMARLHGRAVVSECIAKLTSVPLVKPAAPSRVSPEIEALADAVNAKFDNDMLRMQVEAAQAEARRAERREQHEREQRQAAVVALKAEQASAIAALEVEHAAKLTRLKQGHATALRKLQEWAGEWRAEYISAKEELNKVPDELAARMRAIDDEHRDMKKQLADERDAARQRAAELDARCSDLLTSLCKMHDMSKADLLLEVELLKEQVGQLNTALNTRRRGISMTLQTVGFVQRAARSATQEAYKMRSVVSEIQSEQDDCEAARRQAELQAAGAQERLAILQRQLDEARTENARLRDIAEPRTEKLFRSGHYTAEVDLAVIQCLLAGVAGGKVPLLFKAFARLYGVTIPGRDKTVRDKRHRDANGKATLVTRHLLYIPGISHCNEMASVAYQLNKLEVGDWLLDYMRSDETSCCWAADGAEAQQWDRLGQVLARRINGKLELMALDCATAGKSGEAQADAFKESVEEVVKLMEDAGLVDTRAAELLRRFLPTCAINDRASNGRLASRRVLGLADGDDDPTCAEHALVNILEEGRKAMDKILRELMNFTEEQVLPSPSYVLPCSPLPIPPSLHPDPYHCSAHMHRCVCVCLSGP